MGVFIELVIFTCDLKLLLNCCTLHSVGYHEDY